MTGSVYDFLLERIDETRSTQALDALESEWVRQFADDPAWPDVLESIARQRYDLRAEETRAEEARAAAMRALPRTTTVSRVVFNFTAGHLLT